MKRIFNKLDVLGVRGQILPRAVGEVVDHGDLVTLGQKQVDEV